MRGKGVLVNFWAPNKKGFTIFAISQRAARNRRAVHPKNGSGLMA
jgi:hypothetical protein